MINLNLGAWNLGLNKQLREHRHMLSLYHLNTVWMRRNNKCNMIYNKISSVLGMFKVPEEINSLFKVFWRKIIQRIVERTVIEREKYRGNFRKTNCKTNCRQWGKVTTVAARYVLLSFFIQVVAYGQQRKQPYYLQWKLFTAREAKVQHHQQVYSCSLLFLFCSLGSLWYKGKPSPFSSYLHLLWVGLLAQGTLRSLPTSSIPVKADSWQSSEQ